MDKLTVNNDIFFAQTIEFLKAGHDTGAWLQYDAYYQELTGLCHTGRRRGRHP